MAKNPKPIRQFKKRAMMALRNSGPRAYTREAMAKLKAPFRQKEFEISAQSINRI